MTLHVTLAKLICRCQGSVGLLAASDHFSRGDDPSTFAAYLAECSRKGAPKEHDLFLLRAVLQVLARASLRYAALVNPGSVSLTPHSLQFLHLFS